MFIIVELTRGRSGPNEAHRSYRYQPVACLLLSGRIQAKNDGTPNMTDVNRLGKEANFNQYLIQRIGRVAQGDCSPRAPTDPDLRISRIRLVIS
jgi:hypothetical protein